MAIGSDNFVIAHLLGPTAVTKYSIAMRIFTIVPAFTSMLLMPLWPAYGESVARGEFAWALLALKRSLIGIGAVTFAAAVVLVFSANWIITLWVGNSFRQSLWLLGGMGVWMVVTGLANVVSVFLNSINRVHAQMMFAFAMAASTIAIELLATPRFGLPAVIWSTNVSYLLFIWIPIGLLCPRILKNVSNTVQPSNQRILCEPPSVRGFASEQP
jgi:O-antigen/teichoic acid export membrane protein